MDRSRTFAGLLPAMLIEAQFVYLDLIDTLG